MANLHAALRALHTAAEALTEARMLVALASFREDRTAREQAWAFARAVEKQALALVNECGALLNQPMEPVYAMPFKPFTYPAFKAPTVNDPLDDQRASDMEDGF